MPPLENYSELSDKAMEKFTTSEEAIPCCLSILTRKPNELLRHTKPRQFLISVT